jgi:hypothetical protein
VANLGLVLLARSEWTGALADLDTAITTTRQAIAATSATHPDRAKRLTNLCGALARRCERTGALADLDESITAAREAVAIVPVADPARNGILANLGAALARRSERVDRAADLDEAIAITREAASVTPRDHPARTSIQANLGTALARRFEWTGLRADLDEAITAMRDAVQATPAGHGDRAMWLSNLGVALARRFEWTGVLADLDDAVTAGQQAVDATPADHPDQAEWLANLAAALRARFERTGVPADLEAVAAAARKAVAIAVAPPRVRTRAAREWGRAAASGQRWAEAVAGYEAATSVAGFVAPRSLARRDQEHLLQQLGGLAGDAAACCVRAGMTDRAVELLEQGRGILLGQILDTRTDLTRLAGQHPGLAERFAALRDDLNAAGERGARMAMPLAGAGGEARGGTDLARWQLERRREIAEEFDSVIGEIRSRPGFGGFLRPPPVSELAAAAGGGPVVIVNVSRFGSHALILTSGGVLDPVPLDGLTPDRVVAEVSGFLTAVGEEPASQAAQRQLADVLAWLWDAVAGPVLDRLGITGPPQKGKPWPRLWWCVPGLLSFLPLHAAGHHETRHDAIPRTVTDRVVSSYAPTVRALAYARRARPADTSEGPDLGDGDRLVVVAMPHTPPDAADLPGAQAEADLLRKHFGDRVSTLIGSQATHDTVTSALPGAAWAHFACHGHSDPVSPSASRLLLHDHERRPLAVTDVTRLRMEHAELAFLSACTTARPGDLLADEAIHLASAFQLAGYRHVIGTLWPILDRHAVKLADDVYKVLAATGTATASASALHNVTRRLRDRWPPIPSIWASYIHVGA